MRNIKKIKLVAGIVLAMFLWFSVSEVVLAVTRNPVWVQLHFVFRNDDGSESAATSKAATDTNITGQAKSQNFRLRFQTQESNNQTTNTAVTPRIEYKLASGGLCTDTTGWTTITTSTANAFALSLSSNFADKDPTTNQLGLPGGSSFIAGQILESSNPATAVTPVKQVTEHEWSMQATTNAADSTAYIFRVSNNGTNYDTYTVCPQLTTAAATSLTFTIDTSSVTFVSTLTPGTPISTSSVLTVNTNNAAGYNITINRASTTPTLILSADNSTTISDAPNNNNWTAPGTGTATTTAGPSAVWTAGTTQGLGFRAKQAGTTSGAYHLVWWGTDDTGANALYSGISTSTAAQVLSRNNVGTASNENITVEYKLDTAANQKSGKYVSSPVVYTATVNP